MRKYEYDYTTCKDNSSKVFKETCEKISDFMPHAIKEGLLVDVDGSTIQVFKNKDKEAVVYDDYDVGAVYVLSDINFDDLFERTKILN